MSRQIDIVAISPPVENIDNHLVLAFLSAMSSGHLGLVSDVNANEFPAFPCRLAGWFTIGGGGGDGRYKMRVAMHCKTAPAA